MKGVSLPPQHLFSDLLLLVFAGMGQSPAALLAAVWLLPEQAEVSGHGAVSSWPLPLGSGGCVKGSGRSLQRSALFSCIPSAAFWLGALLMLQARSLAQRSVPRGSQHTGQAQAWKPAGLQATWQKMRWLVS